MMIQTDVACKGLMEPKPIVELHTFYMYSTCRYPTDDQLLISFLF